MHTSLTKRLVYAALLLAFSCNSFDAYHQGILDDLQGSYAIDSVLYINEAGRDSMLLNAGVFYFAPCKVDDNFSSKICSGYYETMRGDTTQFTFQLVNDKEITITPQDLPAAFNIASSTLSFEQEGSKLYLQFFEREQYKVYGSQGNPYLIVLIKR